VQRIHDELVRILGWVEGWEICKLYENGYKDSRLPVTKGWLHPIGVGPSKAHTSAECFEAPADDCAFERDSSGSLAINFMIRPQTNDLLADWPLGDRCA